MMLFSTLNLPALETSSSPSPGVGVREPQSLGTAVVEGEEVFLFDLENVGVMLDNYAGLVIYEKIYVELQGEYELLQAERDSARKAFVKNLILTGLGGVMLGVIAGTLIGG
jgi:hypothetical protein